MAKNQGDGRSDERELDVVIIGGGIAGLITAMGIRDLGLRVAVLEGSNILGGRASSWIDKTTGDPVHIGPHIFLSEYPNLLRLLDEIGTTDKIVWQKGQFINIFDGPKRIVMKMAPLPAPFHFVPSVFRDKTVPHLDKASNVIATLFALQLTEEDILRLDQINAAALLRGLGVTQRYIDRFWAFTSMSIMNVPVELCSAGALMRFYGRMVGEPKYEVGFPDGGLGDVFVPGTVRALQECGISVETNTPVRRIMGDPLRATGVELADGRKIRARRVVAALPPQALRLILRPEWSDNYEVFRHLNVFQPCPYVSVYVWFDRKITDMQFWARVHSPTDLNCDFYDLSNIHRGWEKRPSLITSNTIYSHRTEGMTDTELVERTVHEIRESIPAARDASVRHSVVHRIPMAIHCPYPGTESRRPDTTTPVQNLTLAGDWIRTRLPASMESAALSGWLAAEEIREAHGRAQKLAIPHPMPKGIPQVIRSMGRVLPFKRIALLAHGL